MALVIRPRADWQLPGQPVTGPTYPKATIVDVVYHYPGSGPTANYSDPVKSLRNMQASYLASRGYSLGYNYCVDPTGVVWEVRGVDIRCAATAGYNLNGVACQFLVPGVEPANEAQLSAAVDLHRWLEAHHGRTLGVAGHYQRGTTATACPGSGDKPQLPELERRIRAAAPTPTPPTTPEEDEDMPKTMILVRRSNKSLMVAAPELATGSGQYITATDRDHLLMSGNYAVAEIDDATFDRVVG